MKAIAMLGGTFDPIHHGHLRLALEVRQQCQLDEVRLIPLKQPPHRQQPLATPTQRHEMLKLAIKEETGLMVDSRELERNGVSYSVDTLISLRQDFPTDSLSLIVGQDAFQFIDSWKSWQSLLDYANLLVAKRPDKNGIEYSKTVKDFIAQHQCSMPSQIRDSQNGLIYEIDIAGLEISATDIRDKLQTHQSCRYLLPDSVLTYIEANSIYA